MQEDTIPTSNPVFDALPAYALSDLQDLATQMRRDGVELFDFSIGDPDEPTPEFIRQALIEAVTPSSSYPTTSGHPELRSAVAAWAARRHGARVDPDTEVLPSAGSKEAIFHLPFTVIDPTSARRSVVWGDPGYPVYERGTLFAGGRSEPVALSADRGWLLELDQLPAERLERTAIAWINYPHNPTGAVADRDYFVRQLEVARRYDILLCSDECYQELWFDAPAPSLLEACGGDHRGVVVFVSLSKRSGMTGYRAGAMIGDRELIGRLRRFRPNLGTAPQDFTQAAATVAWGDQDHVDERRAVFARKREVILPFLDSAGIEVSGSDATFYVWFRAPGGDDAAYAEALLGEHIVASPGRSFGAAGAGWMRLALVPTVRECERAVASWGAAIEAGRLPGH